jgi:hypothetical protein
MRKETAIFPASAWRDCERSLQTSFNRDSLRVEIWTETIEASEYNAGVQAIRSQHPFSTLLLPTQRYQTDRPIFCSAVLKIKEQHVYSKRRYLPTETNDVTIHKTNDEYFRASYEAHKMGHVMRDLLVTEISGSIPGAEILTDVWLIYEGI